MIVYNDQYAIVHNDESKPIELGLLIFCEINTTVPKNVKDTDGNNLGNVIVLNEYGKPQRQIVCEGDYSVEVWSYIGPEFDISDLTNFKHLRTDVVIDPTVHIINRIGGETTLNTIEELKEISNATTGTTVQVNGYYESGDCPSRIYVYNENSSAQDDNGGVIKPNEITGNGRWLLVTPEVIDVRYFGVFPSSLYEEQVYYSSRLQAANNYARKYSRTLYFPLCHASSQSLYGLDGITIRGNVKLDRGVKLVAQGGTTSKIISDNFEAYKEGAIASGGGHIEFENVNPYTKWMNTTTNFSKYDKLIYNGSYPYSDMTLQRVEFIVDCNEDISFNGCTLEFKNGTHLNTNNIYSFNNMVIRDDWFTGDIMNPNNLTISNSLVSVDNFVSVKNYWECALMNGDTYFDFQNRLVSYTESYRPEFNKNITIVNANMAMGIKSSASVTLVNVSGTLYATSEFNSLTMKNCSLNSNAYRMKVNTLNASDSILDVNFESPQPDGVINCTRCNVSSIDGFNINLFSCHIFGVIKSKPHLVNGLYVVDGIFNSNTFMTDGYHSVWYTNPTDTNIKVYINWTNNTFLGPNSIVVPQIVETWYFAHNESDHRYVWKGNNGNCPQEVQYNAELGCGKWNKRVYTIPNPSGAETDLQMCHIYFPKMGGMRWGYEKEKIFTSYDPQAFITPAEHHYLAVRGNMWNGNEGVNGEAVPLFNNIIPSVVVSSTVENFYQLCPIWDNYVPCGCVFEMEANLPIALSTPESSTVTGSGFDGIKYKNFWHRYMLSKKEDIEA
jgi:hypothetical protein